MSAIQEFLTIIVNCLSTLAQNFATTISTSIGGFFTGGGEDLSLGGQFFAMAVGIACCIGLVRIAWNFFANIGHR